MEILVSTGSLAWLPLPQRLRLIKEAGADGAELLLTPRLVRQDARQLLRWSNQIGLPIRAVHAVLRLRYHPRYEVEDLFPSAQLAASLLSCVVMTFHPPRERKSLNDWIQAVDTVRETFGNRLCLAIENPEGQDWQFGPFTSFEHFLHFIQEWQLHMTLDTVHAARLGWDIVSVFKQRSSRLASLHVSDATARDWHFGLVNNLLRDHQLPGSGHLPLRPLAAALIQERFTGMVTLELSPLALFSLRPGSVRARLQHAVAFVREAGNLPASHRHRATEQNR